MNLHPAFGSVALLAFWTVLVAELVGDRTLYALSSLSLRFRAGVLFAAFAIASAARMMAAVLLGSAIIRFQSRWTYLLSGVAFFISATLIWFEGKKEGDKQIEKRAGLSKGAVACFSFFFFAEWGDPGQIAAAALVLKSHMLAATWAGATTAMITKGAVAMGLGLQLRQRLPQRTLRLVASVSCLILGILAVTEGLIA